MDVETALQHDDEEIGEEEEEEEGSNFDNLEIAKWKEPNSDDEDDEEYHFDVKKAWNTIFNLPSCQLIMLTDSVQKRSGLFIGVNVTQEFPWKQIPYHKLRDNLFDYIEMGVLLREAFTGYNPDHHVLVGYAPLLTQNREDLPEGDPFVIIINSSDTKLALGIIRNIELYERWVITRRLVKKPRRWVTQGSENEINLTLQQRYIEPVDVEIQSVYPLTIPANKEFTFRKSDDVRDGYVELVPVEGMKFDNIIRKRINVGIQSVPACVDLAQQTDPTFPTNAWAQYFFEIKDGSKDLDVSSADEEEQGHTSKAATPVEPPPPPKVPEMSEQVRLLLNTLEFNQIDMYRDDYPLLCEQQIEHYTNPYLEETLCFANISKSYKRYVSGIDWYPTTSGLIVSSYSFSTAATIEQASRKINTVQRTVLEPNPILMWSFADNLNYKLEFESPMQVTFLRFCPFDSNLLFGGTVTGQIIIWDLQNRVARLDAEETLTTSQGQNRVLIGEFLKWTIQINEDAVIAPATITSLDVSQKDIITGIYWLGRNSYINCFGKIYTVPNSDTYYKYFVTCSLDGTFSFWNFDAATDKKVQGGQASRSRPKMLSQDESPMKNKVLKPIYTVAFSEPITSIMGDTPILKCVVPEGKKHRNPYNYRIETQTLPLEREMRQSMVVSTMYGRLESISWLGIHSETDAREIVSLSGAIDFGRVHDGPIIALRKNPFYRQIFVSIGRNVFAVWKEDYHYSPIFWRKRVCDLTAADWSEDRPAVLFITRIDGYFEAWDILARDDDACLMDILGGGVITAISEHRPSEPEKLIGIGDYNSSLRMIKLPKSFYVPLPNEVEIFKEYIHKDLARKKSIQVWEQKYYENNQTVIEAKRQAEIDARLEMERIEKENMYHAARKAKEAAEEKASEPIAHLSYTERMKRQWDAVNLNRMLSILMSRKRVNAEQLEVETALEKTRLAYESAKKESLQRVLRKVGEEVAEVRAQILPVEVPNLERNDMIQATVTNILELADVYRNVEEDAFEVLHHLGELEELPYIAFLHRGESRRKLLNKSLGGNTERLNWYEATKLENRLDECNWGYEYFLQADAEINDEAVADHNDLLDQRIQELLDNDDIIETNDSYNL